MDGSQIQDVDYDLLMVIKSPQDWKLALVGLKTMQENEINCIFELVTVILAKNDLLVNFDALN